MKEECHRRSLSTVRWKKKIALYPWITLAAALA